VLTDHGNNGAPSGRQDLTTISLPSIRSPFWQKNNQLITALSQAKPDFILWHVSLTNSVYENFPGWKSCPIIGIFTSPLYTRQDLRRIGYAKLIKNFPMAAVTLAGHVLPHRLVRVRLQLNQLASLVVQTQATKKMLLQQKLWQGQIKVIPPGVDEIWTCRPVERSSYLRQELGCQDKDIVVLYMGSPVELRGLPDLVEAFALAHRQIPALKLLVLSRGAPGQFSKEINFLEQRIKQLDLQEQTHILEGFLEVQRLVEFVQASDIVALPFELVPSDAPLSLLEVAAQAKPLVTTRIACLPELASTSQHFLAEPSSPPSLAEALNQAVAGLKNNRHQEHHSKQLRTWQRVGLEWSGHLRTL
jgi:glycosyltransferase involved in cell wall biosynthesis